MVYFFVKIYTILLASKTAFTLKDVVIKVFVIILSLIEPVYR